MTVYVDLVFFTNLAVDGAVLLMTAKLRRFQPSKRRLFAAAAMGAVYAASMFWADVPYLYSFGAKVLVSVAMVLLSFGYGGPLQFFRNFGAFYTVNFATLGGVIGLSYLARSSGAVWGGMSYTPDGGIVLAWQIQLGMFVVTFLLSAWLFHGAAETRLKRGQVDALLWDVEIEVAGESWRVQGLLDTGNRLYDPLTRIPVLIVEASLLKERLPDGWCERLRNESADRLVAELDDRSAEAYPWSARLRLVPYRAVNGNSRLMLAVKPDAVSLSREGHPPLKVTRVLIGLDGGSLSSEGAYRAIVHADLVQAGAAAPAPSQPA